ncbi:hypothetical protein HDU91_006401 [Kappamyces sp. JEL0680]|nr:hypothetical protein HDU91_006401 [Kappamyces sp. JEL0680]
MQLEEAFILGLGTELEKQVRLNAAKTEKAWTGIGQEVGLKIWRIENFHIVAVDAKTYGTFYDGDSYIILNTYKKPDEPKFYHDVHFWLGLETSQDEAGTAAYKTVELDDFLLGAPTQHREVQGFESKLFLSYFARLIVAKGGVDSGFNHVGPKEYKPRLYHIFGNTAKNLSIRQVERSYKSLNDGDVFVLDKGLEIYQLNGNKSTGQEKNKASQFSHAIAADRGGSKVKVFEQDDGDATPFWEGIGGKGPIAPAAATPAPASHVKRLFKISDSTVGAGTLVTSEVATGSAVKKSLLMSDDVFLLDVGSDVFVWVGSGATPQEKKSGLQIAVDYITQNNLPAETPISRVLEGGENAEFYAHLA